MTRPGNCTHDEELLVPISALQHAAYCLRQAALIHLEGIWSENQYTAEGRLLHSIVDQGGSRKVRGVRRVYSMPLASTRLKLTGVADIVEYITENEKEIPFPVEFKRGKPKPFQADEIQLCAQAICLEEMTGERVESGAIFYGVTKKRKNVTFDSRLRTITEDLAKDLLKIISEFITPSPTVHKNRCRNCSLLDQCQPKAVMRSALEWRARALCRTINEETT